MTVCLVIPPSPFLLDERVFMSLGVLRVAAVLEEAGIPVSVCDLSGRLPAEIAAAPTADVYGLTVTSPQLPAAVDIIRQLRILLRDGLLRPPQNPQPNGHPSCAMKLSAGRPSMA